MDEGLLTVVLLCGPVEGDPSEAQMRRAWQALGPRLTKELEEHPRPGLRPWAFWAYTLGFDEEPDYFDGVVCLAERGLLTEGEIERLRDRAAAARVRLDTLTSLDRAEHERFVRLWDAVAAVDRPRRAIR